MSNRRQSGRVAVQSVGEVCPKCSEPGVATRPRTSSRTSSGIWLSAVGVGLALNCTLIASVDRTRIEQPGPPAPGDASTPPPGSDAQVPPAAPDDAGAPDGGEISDAGADAGGMPATPSAPDGGAPDAAAAAGREDAGGIPADAAP